MPNRHDRPTDPNSHGLHHHPNSVSANDGLLLDADAYKLLKDRLRQRKASGGGKAAKGQGGKRVVYEACMGWCGGTGLGTRVGPLHRSRIAHPPHTHTHIHTPAYPHTNPTHTPKHADMRLQKSLARHRDWVERECLRYLQEQPAGQQQPAEVKVSVMSMECMLVGLSKW